jgi:hypothetical protein
MKRTLCFVAIACCLPILTRAQGLQEGTWTGTRVRVGGQGMNPQPQRISVEIKKAPDPHGAWRLEKHDVWNITLVTNQGRVQLSDFQIEGETLMFSYRDEVLFTCRLDRQPDGAFQGLCPGIAGGGRGWRLTLNPPKGSN